MSRNAPLICSALMLSSAAGAAPISERSAFIGRWQLDLAHMPASYGPPPKQVIYTFSQTPAQEWRTTIDITAPDNSIRHMEVLFRPDGQAGRTTGDLSEGDAAAVELPAPNVLVMSIAKDKSLASVRTYTLSASRREMTEAAADVTSDGAPFVRKFHYVRLD